MSKSKGQGSITIKRFKNGGVYLKPSQKDMLARYDFGGFLSGALSGAAKGAAFGPIGMVGGALLGGGLTLDKQDPRANQQVAQPIQRVLPQQQYYTPTFPEGGEVNNTKFNINDDIPTSRFYTKRLPGILPNLKDRAELNYYENILNSELKKKNPNIYSKVPVWNQDKPLTSKTRVAKAQSIAKENPNFYINVEDQKKLLGDSWNQYVKLRGQYGKDLNLVGDNEDPTKPETWNFGARNAAAFNPAGYTYLYQPESSANPTNKFEYEMQYDPSNKDNPYKVTKENRYKYNTESKTYEQYPLGGIAQPNAELEQGEPFRTPNGDISQVSKEAPTHQEGGVPLNLPQGTQILGKMVDPMYGVEFKKLGEQLKKAQDKYQKILDTKPTPLARKTAKMMLDKVQGKYDELMQRQESMKPQQFPYGGMPLMENGRVSMKYKDGGFTPLGRVEPLQAMAVNYAPQRLAISNPYTPSIPQSQEIADNNSNIGDIASTLGSLSPVAYNVAKGIFGKAKQLNPADYMNPYSGQIKSLVANRRYNVDPELESNRLATAQYYQNLKNAAPSQSRYLAGLQSGQISNQRANQEVYARANNMNNQYKADEANTLQGLGQQEANTKLGIQDINSRAQAAKDNYLPTALSQLSQFSQIQKQMSGQKKLDKQRLAVAKEMFKNYPFDVTKIIGQ